MLLPTSWLAAGRCSSEAIDVVGADCVIVNVFVPIWMVADRCVVSFDGATVYATVPEPLPDAPEVTVTQGAELTAVHVHLLVVETLMMPLPPSAVKVFDVGVSV